MRTVGIITIHKINNYGSVFQAYALQEVCKQLGYKVEIIDYTFPNAYHAGKAQEYQNTNAATLSNEPKWIKVLFAMALMRQHRTVAEFVNSHLNLSKDTFDSPESIEQNCPRYDVYITGSDQLWNPRYCKGDPAFMLHFAPDDALKISYAASIGTNAIPADLIEQYKTLLGRYRSISVRETSGIEVIRNLTGKDVSVVLDPTLLLNRDQWSKLAAENYHKPKKKYILCYFLNYTFDAFPYVDNLAKEIQRQTGYDIVRVARPPHKLSFAHTHYRVGASPQEFLSLIRDAEIVLTTSFHGTAFALNFGRPVFSIIQDRNSADSRQRDIMLQLGLEQQLVAVNDPFPLAENARYDFDKEQHKLSLLRNESVNFLKCALDKADQ